MIALVYLIMHRREDDSFCAAVSRDERSYSHQLLLRAAKALERVRPDPALNASFLELVHRVQVRHVHVSPSSFKRTMECFHQA